MGRRKERRASKGLAGVTLGAESACVNAGYRATGVRARVVGVRHAAFLFTDADGTSQREALRRWHLGTVLPLARLLEHELTAKLETPVELKFDSYALDMVSRATVVAKLAQAGVPMATALEAVGLNDD